MNGDDFKSNVCLELVGRIVLDKKISMMPNAKRKLVKASGVAS